MIKIKISYNGEFQYISIKNSEYEKNEFYKEVEINGVKKNIHFVMSEFLIGGISIFRPSEKHP